jgi:hypothetical protein
MIASFIGFIVNYLPSRSIFSPESPRYFVLRDDAYAHSISPPIIKIYDTARTKTRDAPKPSQGTRMKAGVACTTSCV